MCKRMHRKQGFSGKLMRYRILVAIANQTQWLAVMVKAKIQKIMKRKREKRKKIQKAPVKEVLKAILSRHSMTGIAEVILLRKISLKRTWHQWYLQPREDHQDHLNRG